MTSIFKKIINNHNDNQSKKNDKVNSSSLNETSNVNNNQQLVECGGKNKTLQTLQFKLSESNFKIKNKSNKANKKISSTKSTLNLYSSPSMDSNSFLLPTSPYQTCYNFKENNVDQQLISSPILKKSQSSTSTMLSINNSQQQLQQYSDRKIKNTSPGKSNFELKSHSSPIVGISSSNGSSISSSSHTSPSSSQILVTRKKSNLSFISDFGKKKQIIKESQETIERLKVDNLRLNDSYVLDKIKSEIEIAKLNQKIEDLAYSNELYFKLLQDYQRENIELKQRIGELNQFHKNDQSSLQNKSIEDALKSLDEAFDYISELQERTQPPLSPTTELYHSIRLLPSPISVPVNSQCFIDDNCSISSSLSSTMSLSSELNCFNDDEDIEFESFTKEDREISEINRLSSPKLLSLPQHNIMSVGGGSSTFQSTYSSLSPLSNSLSSSCSSVTTGLSSQCSQSPNVKDISLVESQYINNISHSSGNINKRNSLFDCNPSSISMPSSPKPLTARSTLCSSISTLTPSFELYNSPTLCSKNHKPIINITTHNTLINEPLTLSTNNNTNSNNNSIKKNTSIPNIKSIDENSFKPISKPTYRYSPTFSTSSSLSSSSSSSPNRSQTLTHKTSKMFIQNQQILFSSSTSKPIISLSKSVHSSPQLDSSSAVKRLVNFFESPPLKI